MCLVEKRSETVVTSGQNRRVDVKYVVSDGETRWIKFKNIVSDGQKRYN